jgi:hypothetical protein
MSDVIKVGAKLVPFPDAWDPDRYVTVTAVGRLSFLGVPSWAGYESRFDLDSDWVPFVEPVVFPEVWCNVYRTAVSHGLPSRASADRIAQPNRIAVAHYRPDGTVEMERL